jgi:hypothetical protein
LFVQFSSWDFLRDEHSDYNDLPRIVEVELPTHLLVEAVIYDHTEEFSRERVEWFIRAEDFQKLKVSEGTHPLTLAALAYIKELPGKTPILLEWR